MRERERGLGAYEEEELGSWNLKRRRFRFIILGMIVLVVIFDLLFFYKGMWVLFGLFFMFSNVYISHIDTTKPVLH